MATCFEGSCGLGSRGLTPVIHHLVVDRDQLGRILVANGSCLISNDAQLVPRIS